MVISRRQLLFRGRFSSILFQTILKQLPYQILEFNSKCDTSTLPSTFYYKQIILLFSYKKIENLYFFSEGVLWNKPFLFQLLLFVVVTYAILPIFKSLIKLIMIMVALLFYDMSLLFILHHANFGSSKYCNNDFL